MTYKTGIRRIDHIRHVIALGKDTYSTGKISYELVEEMCQVLEEFVQIMKSYKVKDYRAYATSAMREAHNRQIILDQIRVRTGLTVRIISNSEQRFISYKAIAAKAAEFNKIIQKGTAIVDVGFGSAQLSLFDKDSLVTTQNLPLGTLRVRGLLARIPATVEEHKQHIEEIVDNELFTFRKMYLKDREIKSLIATGESILFMARSGIRHMESDRVSAEQFKSFYRKLLSMTAEEIEDEFGIDGEYASILVPSAVIYGRILEMTGAETVWIPGVSLCDGMAAEYTQDRKLVKLRHDFNGDILSSARNMAKRYKCHGDHIQEVERLSAELFDVTKNTMAWEKGTAAPSDCRHSHDCGKLSAPAERRRAVIRLSWPRRSSAFPTWNGRLWQRSYYYNQDFAYDAVKLESDLSQYEGSGLTRRAVTILIAKLTAILSLASAMDRSQRQKFAGASMAVRDGKLLITASCPETIILERASFENRAEFLRKFSGFSRC